MTACIFMLLKSRALPDMLPFSLRNKKRLAIRHMNRPVSDTINSVVRHWEVGWAKFLSAPPRKYNVLLKYLVVSFKGLTVLV